LGFRKNRQNLKRVLAAPAELILRHGSKAGRIKAKIE
jgi:hypothetical protein